MGQVCSVSGCPKDKAYAIIKGNKIHRITFSKSLCEHICNLDNSFYFKKITFINGKKLKKGEKSSSGLYSIISSKNDWTLRITLFQEFAEFTRDDRFRYVSECWILEEEK